MEQHPTLSHPTLLFFYSTFNQSHSLINSICFWLSWSSLGATALMEMKARMMNETKEIFFCGMSSAAVDGPLGP